MDWFLYNMSLRHERVKQCAVNCHKKTVAVENILQCYPVNFAKFLRTPFLQNTYGRLLLVGAMPRNTGTKSNRKNQF